MPRFFFEEDRLDHLWDSGFYLPGFLFKWVFRRDEMVFAAYIYSEDNKYRIR